MNKKCSFILSFFIFLLISQSSYGVIHINGKDTGPKEYVRPAVKYSAEALRKMGYAPEKIMGVISPTGGPKNIAVILVNFENAGSNTSGSNTLTSDDIKGFNTTFNYLKNFYNEESYGILKLNITFFYSSGTGSSSTLKGTEIPYTLTTPMSTYGADTESSLSQLVMDSLAAVGNTLQYTSIGGKYDAVMVAHAGYGNETTQNSGDIWSAEIGPFVDTNGNNVYQNGFSDGISIPAREEDGASPIGVTCHEFGHILGLPDLYNTNTSNSVVGKWDLMDYGPWVNNGYTPSNHSAWCKQFLGWVQPLTANTGRSITDILAIQYSSTTVYQAPILGSITENFLICYSTRSAYNPNPPGGGIEIWHIDEGTIDGTTFTDRMKSNSINTYSHNTVDICPAGNTLPSNQPNGSPNDVWPGLKNVFTSPDSDSYTGQPSSFTLSNIAFSGNTASLALTNIAMANLVSIRSITNYPNPCGRGYFHPRSNNGIITTFVLNLTKVANNIDLTIYNMAGEKVIDIPDSSFAFKIIPSSDYKIIYEYDWNGKNQNSENVAPGLYFYRFKAGNDLKTGKLAIVR